jgi:uncharacterized protein (TIGR03435 family)
MKMIRSVARVVVGFLPIVLPELASAQVRRYALESAEGLRLHNVIAQPVTHNGKKGLRIVADTARLRAAATGQQPGPELLAVIDGAGFLSGVIEAEIAGAPAPGAGEGARGFVGIAFRVQPDNRTYDAFYLRPTNGRADDQERRNHATQYISHPDWPWFRLRRETPGRYESYVDLVPGEWTRVRIEVRGERARLYVHGQQQPTLVVNDVKSGANRAGGVALWIGPGTVAHFRNLTVRPDPGTRADTGRRSFVSASVKPSTSALPPSARGIRLQPRGGFSATAVTLRELIEFAYRRHAHDRRVVTGGPGWIDSARFDIVAKAAGEHVIDADGSPRTTWAMVQALLADRFKLRIHEENRERPVYVLMQARGDGQLGPKLRRTEIDCGAVMRGQGPPMPPSQGPACGMKTPPGRLFANTVTMASLASLISSHLDRVVIDRTGLAGPFDVELEAAEIKAAPDYKPGPSDLALPPAAGPTIFVAVREQLGLKLEPQTATVSVLVIDHAERPVAD